MWLEPTSFSPELGRVLGLKLRVGDDFRGEPIPRNDEMIDRFVVVDAHGQRDVAGRAGADPAGLLRVTAPGPMIVGYQSRPNPLSLSAAKFTSYLKEEALDGIIALREQKGQTHADVREQFIRCAKTLVRAGAGGDAARPIARWDCRWSSWPRPIHPRYRMGATCRCGSPIWAARSPVFASWPSISATRGTG